VVRVSRHRNHGSIPSFSRQSAIKPVSLGFSKNQFLEVSMLGVEQVVPFFHHNGRRHLCHRQGASQAVSTRWMINRALLALVDPQR
jgi:hypothetical protein